MRDTNNTVTVLLNSTNSSACIILNAYGHQTQSWICVLQARVYIKEPKFAFCCITSTFHQTKCMLILTNACLQTMICYVKHGLSVSNHNCNTSYLDNFLTMYWTVRSSAPLHKSLVTKRLLMDIFWPAWYQIKPWTKYIFTRSLLVTMHVLIYQQITASV